MNRTLLSAAAALLLSTGLASAAGLVPGSDQGIREADAAAAWSVVTGTAGARDRTEAAYGYPASRTEARPGTEATDDLGAARTARTPTGNLGGALVPGSDSF